MQGSRGLHAMWSAAATVFIIGVPLAVWDVLWLVPGAFLIVVAAGATAAHGTAAGWGWLLMAWSVPMLPVLALVAAYGYIFAKGLDPMTLLLVTWFLGWWIVVVAAIFGLAAMVEYVRFHTRRRRFGAPRPAWENGPTPPPYS